MVAKLAWSVGGARVVMWLGHARVVSLQLVDTLHLAGIPYAQERRLTTRPHLIPHARQGAHPVPHIDHPQAAPVASRSPHSYAAILG